MECKITNKFLSGQKNMVKCKNYKRILDVCIKVKVMECVRELSFDRIYEIVSAEIKNLYDDTN